MAAQGQKLSLREKVSYGFGDLGYNFYWTMISAFGLYFFTDVFGITPAEAGTLMLVSRLLDAFT
ncbi:MAG: MFS transporter, partial [Asticcacaulis sp.]